MSEGGLLGAAYESDEEEEILKEGLAARQAIAQQFASAADFEDLDELDDGDLPEAIEAAEAALAELEAEEAADLDEIGETAEDEDAVGADLDANELQAAILQAELEGDDETLAGLQAEQARREAKGGEPPRVSARRDTVVASAVVRDSMEVPIQVIGAIIGTKGAAIKQMSTDSGAKMSFEQEEYQPGYLPLSRCCLISGDADAVAKAKQLLQEAVAAAMAEQEQGRQGRKGKGKGQRKGTPQNLASDRVNEGAGGRAGFQQGICKWYAAGFCKFHNDTGSCRNGLHSSEAALKAEADWVAQGPSNCNAEDVKRPVLLLLDLEGGGNKDGRDGEDEIIEVPVLSVCPSTGKELGRFHRFVRPGYWTREEWSMKKRHREQCFNAGANSIPFPEVVDDLLNWLRELMKKEPGELRSEDFLFVTCGNWDVKSAIPRQCSNPEPGAVDVSLQRLLFSRWSNLKEVFRDFYKLSDSVAPTGMRGMLKMLRIPLSGQHHLGMDDVSNLAKILQRLIHEGCTIMPTGQAMEKAKGGKGKGKDGKGKGKFKGKDKGKFGDFHKGGKFGKGGAAVPPPPQGAPKGGQQNGGSAREAEDLGWVMDVGSAGAPQPEVKEPKLKPNQELEDFLNGAPVPGNSWGDEDEYDKDEQPDPDPLAPPRARPGEDWMAFSDMTFEGEDEETGEKPSGQKRGSAEAQGEDANGEGEGESNEPVLKAPRMASLLASLPAPKVTSTGD